MTNITYRKDLQGLRAFAIILVVLAHLGLPLFEGGFIGVDVFFVLSGYLITGLLLKEFHTTQSINFMQFYARRLKRLLPSLILMLIVTIIVAALLVSPYELISKTKSAIYASTWTSNLYFAFSKIGYFSEMELQDLFLHTWSLSVEEQFYLIWPLFIFSCLFIFNKVLKNLDQQKTLLAILFAAFCASFSLALYWSYNQSLWAFYLMPSRIWQFALGGIVFVLFESWQQGKSVNKNSSLFTSIPTQPLGLVLIVFSGVLLAPDVTYPGWWSLIPSIGAALVLVRTQHLSNLILTNFVLTWIGDRSYAWYLWHWPVILIAKTYNIGHTIIEAIFLATLSLIIASISYKIIEVPFWKGKFSKIPTGKSILASFLAMAISVTLMLQILNSEITKLEQNTPNILMSAPHDIPSIYTHGCDSWYENANINPCVFGTNGFNKTVVLIGDSILAQWFSLVTSTFQVPEWRVIVLTKSSCPMVDEDFFYERIGKVYEVCNKWRNDLFDILLEIKPDVIITGSAATYPFSEKQWIEGSKRILSKFSTISNEVIVIPGTPALTFDGPSCLMRQQNNKSNENSFSQKSICSEDEIPKYIKTNKALLFSATNNFENVKLLDLNNQVCPEGKCSAMTSEGIVVFRDSQHITDTFARSLSPHAKTMIESFGIKLTSNNL